MQRFSHWEKQKFLEEHSYENPLLKLIELYPDKPWSYCWLSQNPNITWEFVQANPDKPWDYYRLSSNPNITWDNVQKNPDKSWYYDTLSNNKFYYDDIVFNKL